MKFAGAADLLGYQITENSTPGPVTDHSYQPFIKAIEAAVLEFAHWMAPNKHADHCAPALDLDLFWASDISSLNPLGLNDTIAERWRIKFKTLPSSAPRGL
jgi:hypothetical protein